MAKGSRNGTPKRSALGRPSASNNATHRKRDVKRIPSPPKLADGEFINPKPAQQQKAYKRSVALQRQTSRVRHGLR